ncbi:MAG TPA: phosphohistidine phosphatase SixA [Ignavibacteriaceae bacterium]|nr:phosphohistidine phosphatase SixA [Ignavibacteriaceae bacterium]
MNLYLVRHADAEKVQPGKKDEDRKLSKEGKERIRGAANQWFYFIKNVDIISSSPFIRAVETAEIIAECFEYNDDIIKDDVLAAGSYTKDMIEFVNNLEGNDILVVGHQPDLSEHVSNLISSNGALVDFKKAAIAKISFNGKVSLSKGYLEYLIPSSAFLK